MMSTAQLTGAGAGGGGCGLQFDPAVGAPGSQAKAPLVSETFHNFLPLKRSLCLHTLPSSIAAEPSQAARCRFGDESVSELTGWVRMYHSHHTSVQLKLQERASVNSGKAFA